MNPIDKSALQASLRSIEDLQQSISSPAKIAKIESVRSAIQPNVTHVVVTDTDGVTGLGETFYGASS